MSVDLKAATPDTTIPATGAFLFGADSQSASAPSVYRIDTTILQYLDSLAHTITVNGALSAPATSLTGTWITGGSATTTKPQFLIEPSGTTSTGWSTAGTGIGVNAASGFAGNLFDFQVNGVTKGYIDATGAIIAAGNIKTNGSLWAGTNTGSILLGSSSDIAIYRDAAGVLAQRNGTNAQTFRVYNNYTDSSNYEALNLTWSGNTAFIRPIAAGTGVVRDLAFGTGSQARLYIRDGSGNIEFNTNFMAAVDNTYDIGASGANRPRNGYFVGAITASSANLPIVRTSFINNANDTNTCLTFTNSSPDTVASGNVLLNVSGKGFGYSTGAGGAVTQLTSRTTGVTLNKSCGGITLFSAAGSATPATFTVTNSTVVATDQVNVSVKSGTNKYVAFVTGKAAGSFDITFWAASGTATDAPVITFSVEKAVEA